MRSSGNSTHVMNLGLAARWASILGGASIISYGMKKGSLAGKILAVVFGGDLVYGRTVGHSALLNALGLRLGGTRLGKSVSIPYQQGIREDADITIAKPAEEIYSFWRNLENLPRFMRHLKGVTVTDGKRSHWTAEGM